MSIKRWFSDISYEIILVDNASTDGTIQALEKRFKACNLKIIKNNLNVGFAEANRQGVNMAKGKAILFLNPDTVILDGGISKLLRRLWSDSQIGMIGCRILNSDYTIQKTCARHSPTLMRTFFYFVLMSDYLSVLDGKGQYYHEIQYFQTMKVEVISGCFMLVKTEIIKKYGSFDDLYFMYAEDIELCNRIRKNGYQILYVPEMNIMHYGGMSSIQHEKNYYGYIKKYESDCRYFKRLHGEKQAEILRYFIILGSFLRMIGLLIKKVKTENFNDELCFLIKKHRAVISWALRRS